MERTRTLKPRQAQAIQLLAMGKPINEVAAILEVSTMTLFRWRKLPEFSEKLNSITVSGLEEVAKKMNIAALTAVETLQYFVGDLSLPVHIQIKAAFAILKAMPSVNRALEEALQHGGTDFDPDPRKRWAGPAFTYDRNGNRIMIDRGELSLPVNEEDGVEV
ncbi:MAG: hypothetical protein M0T84_04105 [Betaproteobacteria bacterium]|nr:hypothetical protein [Betaproteobacteria bacterium]